MTTRTTKDRLVLMAGVIVLVKARRFSISTTGAQANLPTGSFVFSGVINSVASSGSATYVEAVALKLHDQAARSAVDAVRLLVRRHTVIFYRATVDRNTSKYSTSAGRVRYSWRPYTGAIRTLPHQGS